MNAGKIPYEVKASSFIDRIGFFMRSTRTRILHMIGNHPRGQSVRRNQGSTGGCNFRKRQNP
jgi:hypothetical protein